MEELDRSHFSHFFDLTEFCVGHIQQCYEDDGREEEKEDSLELIELVLKYGVLLLSATGTRINEDQMLLSVVESVQRLTTSMMRDRERASTTVTRCGPLAFDISKECLAYYVEHHFRTSDISAIFGCSSRTIKRMSKYGLLRFTPTSNESIDAAVKDITSLFPRSGEKMVSGRLQAYGIRVSLQRARDSLQRVDPLGIHAPCRNILHCRKYQVASSNALWHLDGYHKLIRWKVIIHSCIDEFSRLIVYLKVAPNNLATTVLECFRQEIREYGLPSLVFVWTEEEKI